MVVSEVSLPKFEPSGPRVPLMTCPVAVMNALLSLKGPQGVWPGARLAGLLEKQTERGIARIGLLQHQKVMRLSAHIAGVEHGIVSEAALDRKHVFLGVRNSCWCRIIGHAADRLKLRPVETGSGWLAEVFSGASSTGKYWPTFWPLAAVTNGVANSGGAGLV